MDAEVNSVNHTRQPHVGDTVTIHNGLCEWDGVSGTVISVSGWPDDTMPYMVQRPNFDIWPFSIHELELHSLENETYEGGWVDPWEVPIESRYR